MPTYNVLLFYIYLYYTTSYLLEYINSINTKRMSASLLEGSSRCHLITIIEATKNSMHRNQLNPLSTKSFSCLTQKPLPQALRLLGELFMYTQQKIDRIIKASAAVSAIIGEEYTKLSETELNKLHQLRKDLLKLAEKLNGY